ncbi:DUF58 domain-containing protein [Putridiphycobacter roseus]|uniref:DUF58 domain-containing protein n=1 Tax=Putridiphycobacter roseus TaxID=2219161 RepID=A0A2W1MWP7_9FLAO|nr:DUF58 domain-containing protein [Putridiphycobacter roseus]PZE16297.1 DUF58 domain-containing protein [Putridiphycobacter roseus]
MKLLRSLYFTNWFYIALLAIVFAFILAFPFPFILVIAQGGLFLIIAITVLEFILLYRPKKPIEATREVNNPISMGDENPVRLKITNKYKLRIRAQIFDNTPAQLQLRDLSFLVELQPGENKEVKYMIKPTERGVYTFGDLYVYVSTFLHFVQRKVVAKQNCAIAAYPSILQMKKMELKVFTKTAAQGIKKIRRLGHNNEFEQIKNYVQGDDFRTVNWKATSRRNELMVNQYQDERSQNIYSIIDKSRTMHMPFEGLTLLDYAINSTLAFSNVAMKKGDKVGLHTFSNKLGSFLKAERSTVQLKRIIETLYHQQTHFLEADYNLLYSNIRNKIKGRSLIMLYCNIESTYTLKRILPHLKRINKNHLLVLIFFENTEINAVLHKVPKHVGDIYLKTFAEKYKMDKKRIALELKRNGIQTILTTPSNLSVATVNKYLEMKSRGLI